MTGKQEDSRDGLRVGIWRPQGALDPVPTILIDAPRLRRFARHPAFRAYVGERLGSSLVRGRGEQRRTAVVPLAALRRHAVITGGSGGGKTRLLLLLCRQLVARRFSLVLIDPKGETADLLLAQAAADPVPPETVTVLDARRSDGEGIPGCNPFLTGIDSVQAVCDFASLVKASAASWGARLEDLLVSGLHVIACHGLSIDALVRFLTVPDYREMLLRAPVGDTVPLCYQEACNFFRHEFGVWSASRREEF